MDHTLTAQERALAARCLEIARAKGAQKARVTLNKSCMDLIGTLNGEVDKVSHCLDRSISIALFVASPSRMRQALSCRLLQAQAKGFRQSSESNTPQIYRIASRL